jgi:peptidoglycan/LPS O-acetylase OafA/YrhL
MKSSSGRGLPCIHNSNAEHNELLPGIFQNSMISLRYRTDIDGLRAVAVLGVVIYHAFPWLIPGGFIGVDIFFVISGYLISGILYKGHSAGNFSFGEFYARRIRRLFPALIVMMVITMAYGRVILLPDEFRQLGKHVAAGTLFIQNIVFWQESGYFDTAASLKPLLHLWSLAVEEQFYIFFPLVLILLWKKPRLLVPAMVALLVGTLILNVVMSVKNGVSDFFLTPYRAWEFLGGSLLAWWHYDRGHEEEVPVCREALSWGGLILLVLGFALIHNGDPYPGWRAVLPVAGTLLLMEGGGGAWVNRRILSNPAVVWVGLISYPLYLFHWPALAFVHIVKGESPKPVYILDALAVSLALTILTYYLVEKKLRHNKSPLTIPSLITTFLAVGSVGLLIARGVIPPAPMNPEILKFKNCLEDKDSFIGLEWLSGPKHLCVNRVGGNGPVTLFFGDSNTQQYMPRIVKLLQANHGTNGRGALIISGGGVPPIPGVYRADVQGSSENFAELREVLGNTPSIDRVVIAARWDLYFKPENKYLFDGKPLSDKTVGDAALKGFGGLIAQLRNDGKKVTVVLNTPNGGNLDPRHFYKRDFVGSYSKNLKPVSRESYRSGENGLGERISTVALASGATVIDPLDFLCPGGFCLAETPEGPIRYDINHLRPGFVRDQVTYLDPTVAP